MKIKGKSSEIFGFTFVLPFPIDPTMSAGEGGYPEVIPQGSVSDIKKDMRETLRNLCDSSLFTSSAEGKEEGKKKRAMEKPISPLKRR